MPHLTEDRHKGRDSLGQSGPLEVTRRCEASTLEAAAVAGDGGRLCRVAAALSGSAIACPARTASSSNDIKKNAVVTGKVKNNNLRGADVRNDTLTGLRHQERGDAGKVPSVANADIAGAAQNAVNAQNDRQRHDNAVNAENAATGRQRQG